MFNICTKKSKGHWFMDLLGYFFITVCVLSFALLVVRF